MGTYTEADALTTAYRTLRDTASVAAQQLLTDTELTGFIRQAERRYSIDRPLELAVDATADGSATLAIPGAVAEGERITAIEYPLGETPPAFVDARAFVYYLAPSGRSIRWIADLRPASGASVRLTYTAPRAYAVSAVNTTVLDRDHFAVCDLVCSYAAQAIAAKYARTHEPLVNADSASYRTKQQEWTDLAKRWFNAYRDGLGIGSDAGASRPAGGFANWDGQSSLGTDYLWHRRGTR